MKICRFPSSLNDKDTPQLIVGLGNPGAQYADTRHNVGFMVVDALATEFNLSFTKSRFGLVARGQGFWLLKPLTFMNLSGEAVGPMMRWHRILPSHLLVVGDDLDLPLGRLRLRQGGSSGGHNGLKSIMEAVQTENFPRLRIGIDRPPPAIRVIDWVLTPFAPSERDILTNTIDRAAKAAMTALVDGITMAMNRFNREPGD